MKKKRRSTKTALALSAVLLALWVLMGTNATLAWFSDSTQAAKNTFIIGDLNLDVDYKNGFVTSWMDMESDSKVFNEKALYEPGYTQVVWLKVQNKGTVDFEYKVTVDVNDYTSSVNQYGAEFCLPPYLRFGVLFGADEIELERKLAQIKATNRMSDYMTKPLNTYSEQDVGAVLRPGDVRYAAVVVYMPEEVGNEANYRKGYDAPQVELGMTVFAQQAGTQMP